MPIEKELEDIYVEDSVGVVSEGGMITTQSIQRHVGQKQTDESETNAIKQKRRSEIFAF